MEGKEPIGRTLVRTVTPIEAWEVYDHGNLVAVSLSLPPSTRMQRTQGGDAVVACLIRALYGLEWHDSSPILANLCHLSLGHLPANDYADRHWPNV